MYHPLVDLVGLSGLCLNEDTAHHFVGGAGGIAPAKVAVQQRREFDLKI